MQTSTKLYLKQFIPAILLYCVLVLFSSWVLSNAHSGWWRIPIALLPILPCLLVVRAVVAFYGRCDEMQVRIHLQSLAFAFAGTAILTLTYGFLQYVGFPTVNWVWVWPLMASLWVAGAVVANRKYR